MSIDLEDRSVNHFPGLEKRLLEEILAHVSEFFDRPALPVTPNQDHVAAAGLSVPDKSIDPQFVEVSSSNQNGSLKIPNRRKSYILILLILSIGLSLVGILNLSTEISSWAVRAWFSLTGGIILMAVSLNDITTVFEANWDVRSVQFITKSIFHKKRICCDWDLIQEFKMGRAYRRGVGPIYFIQYSIGNKNSIFADHLLERQASYAAQFLERKRLEYRSTPSA